MASSPQHSFPLATTNFRPWGPAINNLLQNLPNRFMVREYIVINPLNAKIMHAQKSLYYYKVLLFNGSGSANIFSMVR